MTGIIEFIEQAAAYLSSEEFTRLSIAAITIMGVFVTFMNRSKSLEAYSAKKAVVVKETQYQELKNQMSVVVNYNRELLTMLEKQNLLFAEAFLNSKLSYEAKAKIAKIVADMKKPEIDGEVFAKAKKVLESAPVIETAKEIVSNLAKLKGE
jgi:hypothetical protein